jgi:hypothetical protein
MAPGELRMVGVGQTLGEGALKVSLRRDHFCPTALTIFWFRKLPEPPNNFVASCEFLPTRGNVEKSFPYGGVYLRSRSPLAFLRAPMALADFSHSDCRAPRSAKS